MDWIKKNMVFVVSCAVALLAIGASVYYLLGQMQKYEEVGGRLDSVVSRVNGFVQKRPHPGHGEVDNIERATQDIATLDAFKAELTRTFKSTPVGEESEQAFKSALADMLAFIEREGGRTGLTTPTNFTMSFTAQKVGFRFASNSLGPLNMQLADLSEITRILVAARVNSIEAYRRVAVSEDDKGEWAVADEYIRNIKIKTNEFTGAVIHPYEVEFRCFSYELGKVLEGIAASPYSLILKTIKIDPATIRNLRPRSFSATGPYGGIPGLDGPPAMFGTNPDAPGSRFGGRNDGGMASRYGGGGRESGMSSRYGSSPGAARPRYQAGQPAAAGAGQPATINTATGVISTRDTSRPTGPVTLLKEEPLRVTLGFAAVRMPDPAAAAASTN